MKCEICGKKLETLIEIKTIRGNYCCNTFSVDLESLRPKVKEYIISEKLFWSKLLKAIETNNYS